MRMSGSPYWPAGAPPVTPLTLSSPTKATLFRIMSWRCWATFEHGIAQPNPRDLQWRIFLNQAERLLRHAAVRPLLVDRSLPHLRQNPVLEQANPVASTTASSPGFP